MTRVNYSCEARRRGSITALTCILLPLILGMVAFAVDISWLSMTRSELQNAADSAALAGANRLGDNYVLFSLPTQTSANKSALITNAISTAKAAAKTYAAANNAGGVTSLVLLDSDIEVGNTDSAGLYLTNAAAPTLYPNTIKVILRRDSTANTSLNMFFAPVIGVTTVDVQANATAMAYGGTVNSFRTDLGNAAGMLPITYDVNDWNAFLKTGLDPDGNANRDASGNPQIQIYPSVNAPGNFGWISLNDSHVGANTLRNWINSGPDKSDIQALVTNGLIPLSQHASKWDWQGDTGFKASDVSSVNNNIGNSYIIPLYKPFSTGDNYSAGVGQGSNYYYNIVSFVGIKIMPPTDTNREVVVIPVPIIDPTMILNPGSVAPLSGSGSTTVTALAPPRLTN